MKAGDVVQLKSGGQKMTIMGIIDNAESPLGKTMENVLKMSGYQEGDIYCQWFDNKNTLVNGCFKVIMLKVVDN